VIVNCEDQRRVGERKMEDGLGLFIIYNFCFIIYNYNDYDKI
jgi:hypothetical protein